MENCIYKSKISTGLLIFLLLGGIGFIAIGVYLFHLFGEGLENYLGLCFFGGSGVLTIIVLLFIPSFQLYNDRIEKVVFFGKFKTTYYLEDLIKWRERKAGYGIYLVLEYKNSKLKLESSIYKDFESFKKNLPASKQEVDYQDKYDQKLFRILSVLSMILAIPFFIISLYLIIKVNFLSVSDNNVEILEKIADLKLGALTMIIVSLIFIIISFYYKRKIVS